jgi:multiple sugar transport system substrate-binding protein
MRWTRAAVAAVALALAVSACGSGGSSTTSTKQEITIWHYWDGNNAETFASMVQQYQSSHQNVSIKLVSVPGADLLTKIQTAATTHTLPDASIGDLVTVPRLIKTGALADLKPLIPAATWQDIYPSMLSFGADSAAQRSIPVSANDLGLMYNEDLFTAAGLDPAKPPTTWEEMKTASATILAKTGKPGFELFTQAGTDGEGLTWNFQVSLWQAGGDFLTSDNSKAAFNSDAGRKALQFWVDLVNAKASPLAPWGEFEKGKAASAQEGSWMVGVWKAQPPFKFGVAQIPHPSDGKAATNLGGEQAVVYSTSSKAHQQATADFLSWFTDPAQNLAWSEKTGFLPVRRSVASGNDFASYVQTQEPDMRPFVDALPSAHARPNTAAYPKASLAFAKQAEQALYGKKSVATALSDAEKDVNAALSAAQ